MQITFLKPSASFWEPSLITSGVYPNDIEVAWFAASQGVSGILLGGFPCRWRTPYSLQSEAWGHILSPRLGDLVDSGIGLPYWPAGLCSLAGRYDHEGLETADCWNWGLQEYTGTASFLGWEIYVCPALAALVGPVQILFFLTIRYAISINLSPSLAGSRAGSPVSYRNVCLWVRPTTIYQSRLYPPVRD